MTDEEVKAWIKRTRKVIRARPDIKKIAVTACLHSDLERVVRKQNEILGADLMVCDGPLMLCKVPIIVEES